MFSTLTARSRRVSCSYPIVVLLIGFGAAFFAQFEQTNASSEQVIAHVGSQDVTLSELENEFRSENIPIDQQQNRDVVKRVVNKIVLRKYLMQEAIAAKLDRDPDILLNILRSREEVLSTAIIQRHVLKDLAALSVDQYISASPLKFATRKKIFKIDQISVPLNEATQSVVEAAKRAKTLEEVEQEFRKATVPHGRSEGLLKPSDLPEEIVERIESNKEELFFISSGANAVFFKVVGEENVPLSPEQTMALARQYLKRQLFEDEIRRATLAAQEQATFEGDYATIMDKSEPRKKPDAPKETTLADIWRDDMVHIIVAFAFGFAFGYGVRALLSWQRRRVMVRKRYVS
jgi:EpsD family peptidyl-prolyl cis-trans isomerase